MTVSDREIAAALGQAIAERIGEQRYKIWFEGRTKFSWKNEALEVGVPNRHFQEWLQKTFAETVRLAASESSAGWSRSVSPLIRNCSRLHGVNRRRSVGAQSTEHRAQSADCPKTVKGVSSEHGDTGPERFTLPDPPARRSGAGVI